MNTETQSTRAGDGIPAGWFEGPHGAFRANPAFKMIWPPQSLQWQIPLYLAAPAVSAPPGYVLVESPITEEMHQAACKVLLRAGGLDGTPQRMLDALAAIQGPATGDQA